MHIQQKIATNNGMTNPKHCQSKYTKVAYIKHLFVP